MVRDPGSCEADPASYTPPPPLLELVLVLVEVLVLVLVEVLVLVLVEVLVLVSDRRAKHPA